MPTWLMKSEPDEFSIDMLRERGEGRWDGVRNYQARNFLRGMQKDELFFFYHSSCAQPGIAGIGRITATAYPDPSALDPHSPYHDPKATATSNPWSAVDVAFVEAFAQVLPLPRIRAEARLEGLELIRRGSRLSVMPVADGHWQLLLQLARS